ncbi:hypothetical protein EAX61_10560 [Dokdonia sinensis]|uniref:Uncharacterized protein n=1 Tax=Dokdonia sinensis TaxID=2479847 RepID=A0A3M0FZ91_9FLAO|nr:hypothetical protein [Dokdonia sinensis]RMB58051.1 hypothetical protein EAX61_10560 [Dokdonia sinensis]
MKKYITYISIVIAFTTSRITLGQEDALANITEQDLEYLASKEDEAVAYMEYLKTPGVKIEGQEMIFNKEAQRLLSNESYRTQVYPATYSFAHVKASLSVNDFHKAFWQMINLYPDHKEDVVRFIYAYDSVFPTDEVLIASFYTYGFFDPKITKLDGGKPNVYRPDIFEEYLRRTREIITYIEYFRKEAKEG